MVRFIMIVGCDQVQPDLKFLRGGSPAQDLQVSVIDSIPIAGMSHRQESSGRMLRLHPNTRMIHHPKCLRGNRAGISTSKLDVGIGKVKDLKNLWQCITEDWQIDAAACCVELVSVLDRRTRLDRPTPKVIIE